MNDENREKFKEIFLKIFQNMDKNDFDFNKDRSQFENWDSLTHMQLVSEIESAFGVNFEMDEIVDINKPADLMGLIEERLTKKKNG